MRIARNHMFETDFVTMP